MSRATITADTAYIETYTGRKFYPLAPRGEDINILDIAHALSNVCRYTGHIRTFYSVAEHCLNVAAVLPDRFKLEGLLHDASEAYIADIAGPIKPFLPDYMAAEKRLEAVLRERFGLPAEMSPEVHEADMRMLVTEARDLGMSWWEEWRDRGTKPYQWRVIPETIKASIESRFIKTFIELGGVG